MASGISLFPQPMAPSMGSPASSPSSQVQAPTFDIEMPFGESRVASEKAERKIDVLVPARPDVSAQRRAEDESFDVLLKRGDWTTIQKKIAKADDKKGKVAMLLQCISELKHAAYQIPKKGPIESNLMEELLEAAKEAHSEVMEVLERPEYKYDPKLKEVWVRMEYLSPKPCTRFVRACSDTMYSTKARTAGVAFFLGGAALMSSGFSDVFSSQAETRSSGTSKIVLGASLMCVPVIQAVYYCCKRKPERL